MEITLLLEFTDRQQLRDWRHENHTSAKECWVVMSRSKTPRPAYYLTLMSWKKHSASVGLTVPSRN